MNALYWHIYSGTSLGVAVLFMSSSETMWRTMRVCGEPQWHNGAARTSTRQPEERNEISLQIGPQLIVAANRQRPIGLGTSASQSVHLFFSRILVRKRTSFMSYTRVPAEPHQMEVLFCAMCGLFHSRWDLGVNIKCLLGDPGRLLHLSTWLEVRRRRRIAVLLRNASAESSQPNARCTAPRVVDQFVICSSDHLLSFCARIMS